MPAPEHGPGGPPEQSQHQSPEPAPYRRAARFTGEQPAGEAYFAVQRIIYEAPQQTDLSVFRLQLNRLWHVAALGLLPPAPVLIAIEQALAAGQPTELPEDVWHALAQRRVQANQQAPWVQRHFRPGQPLEES